MEVVASLALNSALLSNSNSGSVTVLFLFGHSIPFCTHVLEDYVI